MSDTYIRARLIRTLTRKSHNGGKVHPIKNDFIPPDSNPRLIVKDEGISP